MFSYGVCRNRESVLRWSDIFSITLSDGTIRCISSVVNTLGSIAGMGCVVALSSICATVHIHYMLVNHTVMTV